MREYYEINDGRIWDTLQAKFLENPSEDEKYQMYISSGNTVIKALDSSGVNSIDGLKECLAFYGFSLGELETVEEKNIRIKNEARLKSEEILKSAFERQLLQTTMFTEEEYRILADAEMFPIWSVGKTYYQNQRIQHNGVVYEVLHQIIAQKQQSPDSAGMTEIYLPLFCRDDTEHV